MDGRAKMITGKARSEVKKSGAISGPAGSFNLAIYFRYRKFQTLL
jgi:hypothetical protein